jgi:hypothetical protein
VADDDQAAAVVLEVVAQPDDRVGVQVVRRLVEQQRLRVAEQDPGQLDPPPLAAGQGAQRLVQHPVGQPEAGGEARRLRFRGVTAEHGEPVAEIAIAADGLFSVIRIRHLRLGLAQLLAQLIEPAGGQHPVEREHVKIPGARVLRQVADGAAAPYRAGGRLPVAGEHLGKGGLPGAVAAHETDPVALRDLERCISQQQPCAGAQLYATGDDHDVSGYLIRVSAP